MNPGLDASVTIGRKLHRGSTPGGRMRRTLAVLGLLAAGCGHKTNTPVTDQGKTLSPQSSAAVVATVLGFLPITEVIVTDIPDICGKFSGINACNPGASSATGVVTDGSILPLAALANASGDFPTATA